MNCLEFRRLLLAEPLRSDENMVRHQAECAGCHALAVETRRLEASLRSAVAVEPPEALEARALLRQVLCAERQRSRRYFMLRVAAGVAGVVAAGALVANLLRARLPAEIVAHAKPADFAVASLVPAERVTHVLQNIGHSGGSPALRVIYANNCIISEQLAAHLVLEQDGRAVNVILMPTISVTSTERFRIDRYVGEIRTFGPGSVAVVAEDADKLEPAYRLVASALPG
jgi:hypothetical protein